MARRDPGNEHSSKTSTKEPKLGIPAGINKESSMSACAACFAEEYLCICIAEHLDCSDLHVLESVSKSWQVSVGYAFRTLRDRPSYKFMAFKASTLYSSDKRICSAIFNSRNRSPDRLVLVGGSFGSLRNDSCLFNDMDRNLEGTTIPVLSLPIKIGSAAYINDSDENLLLLGGWDDDLQVVLQDIYMLANRKVLPKCVTWKHAGSLPRPLCFPAAARTLQGDLVVIGGGDSPYRGGHAFAECILRRVGQEAWKEGILSSLHGARCGHSAVTTFSGAIVCAGGYAGGSDYLSSAELLDPTLTRWTPLPSMSVARSGMAMVLGPDGAVYAAGGSPDGAMGHKSLERLDLREGKWTKLCDMKRGRGYTAGIVSTWGTFLVCGGLDAHAFQPGMESYDFRTGLWSPAPLPAPVEFSFDKYKRRHLPSAVPNISPKLARVLGVQVHSTQQALRAEVYESKAGIIEDFQAGWSGVSEDDFQRACHSLLHWR